MLSSTITALILYKTCVATTPATWRSCVNAANNGTVKRIEVRAPITCTAWEPCDVTITGINGLTVTGVSGTGSALRRRAFGTAPLITVANASNVTISDLVIDEDETFQCVPVNKYTYDEDPSCPHSIVVWGSTTVKILRNSIYFSPKVAVRVFSGDHIEISDNKLIESRLFGAQIGETPHLIVANNLFHKNASNALVLGSIHPPGTAWAYVMNNFFVHNHRHNMYWGCGTGAEPCGGGQLFIHGDVSRLWVTGNVIRDGWSEDFPGTTVAAVGGIEIDDNVTDVWFGSNSIHDNSGWGISVNPGKIVWAIDLTDNEWWGNGTAPYYNGVDVNNLPPGRATYSNNCTTPGCQGIQAGAVYAKPNPCLLASGFLRCRTRLVWLSNNLWSPALWSGSLLLSTDPSGEISPYLTAGTYEYQLRDEAFFPSLPVATTKLVVR